MQNAVLAPSHWLKGSVILFLLAPLKPIVGKSFFNGKQNVCFALTLAVQIYSSGYIQLNLLGQMSENIKIES